MKTKKSTIAILMLTIVLGITLWSCSKKDETPADTCPGKNLTATLNGSAFSSVATAAKETSAFKIEAKDCSNSSNTLLIQLNPDSMGVKTYTFKDVADFAFNGGIYAYGSYANSAMKLFLSDPSLGTTGTVTITKYDVVNKKVSGTFSVNLYENASSKVTFTSGTFTDVKWN